MTDEVGQPRWLGCTLPPEGWWCSREEGHEGPCAARPDEAPEEDDSPLSDADKARIDAAWESYKPLLAATTARPTERGAVEAVTIVSALSVIGDGRQHILYDDQKRPVLDFAARAAIKQAIAALTPPVTVAATDSRITKDWCLNMARLEAGQEIGAGMPGHPLRAPEVAATDQAGEVERLRADMYTMIFFSNMPMAARLLLNRAYHALDTKSATGRTMGGEERKWKAALQDIAEAEAIPNDAVAFVWCRDVARAALQNGVE